MKINWYPYNIQNAFKNGILNVKIHITLNCIFYKGFLYNEPDNSARWCTIIRQVYFYFDLVCVRHWYLKDEYKYIKAEILIF